MAALAGMVITVGANADSVGFDALEYDGSAGEVFVTVNYDFTDLAMYGGSLDLIYDPNAIEFVSYTRAPPAFDVQLAASPIGSLEAPGLYAGFGVGSGKFFAGTTSANAIGTFHFNVLGPTDTTATPCGMTLCLQEDSFNPFVSLFGDQVGADLLAAGISGAEVVVVPAPAGLWLLLSALGVLCARRRQFGHDC